MPMAVCTSLSLPTLALTIGVVTSTLMSHLTVSGNSRHAKSQLMAGPKTRYSPTHEDSALSTFGTER